MTRLTNPKKHLLNKVVYYQLIRTDVKLARSLSNRGNHDGWIEAIAGAGHNANMREVQRTAQEELAHQLLVACGLER